MRNLINKTSYLLAILLMLFVLPELALPQVDPLNESIQQQDRVIVIKNDGARFIGFIISRDDREILLETETVGRLFIPLHEIREIRPFSSSSGPGSNLFATRYFLTTNGFSMSKGEKYAMTNYWGPDINFAVADNFTVGAMTSWLAMPLIGTVKFSFKLSENLHASIGGLFGTLSWVDFGYVGALGYGTITIGNSDYNVNLSGGYAGISGEGGAPLLSPAMLLKLGDRAHFVLDSFIYLGEDVRFGIVVPGIRIDRPTKRASFQIGMAGLFVEGEAIPLPIPIMGWFYEL